MLTRDMIMVTIKRIYEARLKDDMQSIAFNWAPDAIYRLAGDGSLATAFAVGPDHPDELSRHNTALVRNHEARIVDSVVEGNKAAVHMEVVISIGDSEPVPTEYIDLWEFNDQGQYKSLQQFADTALLMRLVTNHGQTKRQIR